jgi:hypothetical protein
MPAVGGEPTILACQSDDIFAPKAAVGRIGEATGFKIPHTPKLQSTLLHARRTP